MGRGRPRKDGSATKSTNATTNIKVDKNNYDIESDRQLNELASVYVDGFISRIYSDGIIQDITMNQLQNYLSNPDNYIREMENLAMYYYISDGTVFQLFDLAKVLPTLNYKIDVLDKTKSYETNLVKCNKALNKVRHKQLTRDLLSQEVSSGTVTGIWLGDKKNPYLYVFDDVRYFYPSHRINGDWVVVADLSYLNTLNDNERKTFISNLSPYIKQSDYDNYKTDSSKNLVALPQDRTICLRTHTLRRNQRYGINWSTVGLFDLGHKKKLKDLEKAVANKIINSIAVLTIGNKDKPEEFGNIKLNKELKKKVHAGVKAALEKNQTQGVTVVAIPEFADLKFPDLKSEPLQPEKFNSINNDITSSYGMSNALLNGTGSNFASAKINLEILYKKLSVLLEDIETEVYGKLFRIILPVTSADDYQMVYDKEPPLSNKDKVDYLFKLHSEGFAVKPILDSLSGISYEEYILQSIYELETLKLADKIRPYQTAYTNNGDKNNGRPTNNDPNNESTIRSKTTDGNNNPD